MTALNELTVTGARSMLAEGKCSSVELVTEIIKAIKERDAGIGAYLAYDEDGALSCARAADEARSRGNSDRLLGIPVAVKDNLNVDGQPCTCASRILDGYSSVYDAGAVAGLRKQGAIFLGRTNMDEFAMGSTCENSSVRPTANPWDADCVPGGSSGGSAAAVAANEALAALGSDTGGSIRQPAAFCGCVGLKPSYGRVSRYGLVAFASSLDQVGSLTKTVEDAATILNAIAGWDSNDSTSLNVPVPDYESCLRDDLKGMTLGVPSDYFVEGLDPEVEKTLKQAVEQCKSLGASVVDVNLETTRHCIAAYYIIACAEASANLARFDGVRYGFRATGSSNVVDMYKRTRAGGFGAEVKRRILLGTYVLSSGYYDAYYLRAQKIRTLIRRDFEAAFEKCDALLAPVTPTAAYKLGEKRDDPLEMYLGDIFTVPVNLAGLCGMSVPCGFTEAGLPVGLQIIGPAFKEETILGVGSAYERSQV